MARDFNVIVQKYGGSSLADSLKIRMVAQFIQSYVQNDTRICVVVSAMGNTTNDLISLAYNVAKDPSKRELDMLISCGERISMALLAMALNEMGVKAISLTGSQSGIITDDNHSQAQIIEVKPSRVFLAFSTYQVVIIAGFQGVSLTKEITTLRRGGSDTTAVAMAAALKANVCEIYTDVAGVMDCDPKIISHAKMLKDVTLKQMESMTLYGAKVVAHDAIVLAKELGIVLRVAKTGESSLGTNVHKLNTFDQHGILLKKDNVLGITHLRAIIRFSLNKDDLGNFINREGYFLCGSCNSSTFVGYISNDIAQEFISSFDAKVNVGLALLTIHLQNDKLILAVFAEVTNLFKKHNIAIQDALVTHDKIFIIVDDSNINKALEITYIDLLGGSS